MQRKGKTSRPKLSDVAQAAGVSVSMVSRILSKNMGNTSASEEVVARVRDAAAALHYAPDRRARNLRMGKNDLIAVMLPLAANFSTSIYTELLRGLGEEMRSCEYDFVYQYYHGYNEELRVLRTVLKMNIDGLIYAPHPYMPMADEIGAILRQLMNTGVQVVFCMEHYDIPGSFYVDVDDALGGRMMAQYLLGRGYRNILFLHHMVARRRDAFAQAVQEADGCLTVLECGGFSVQNGERAMADHLSRLSESGQALPDAVACICDIVAVGVRRAVLAAGFKDPPFDITGFDYLSFVPLLERPIPSIHQPSYEVGRLAVQNLLRALSGQPAASLTIAPQLMLPAGNGRPQAGK